MGWKSTMYCKEVISGVDFFINTEPKRGQHFPNNMLFAGLALLWIDTKTVSVQSGISSYEIKSLKKIQASVKAQVVCTTVMINHKFISFSAVKIII